MACSCMSNLREPFTLRIGYLWLSSFVGTDIARTKNSSRLSQIWPSSHNFPHVYPALIHQSNRSVVTESTIDEIFRDRNIYL